MTENKRILELATKWLAGTITDREKKEFASWYNSYDDTYFQSSATGEDALKERMFSRISAEAKLSNKGPESVHRIRRRWPLGIAASFLIVLSVLFLCRPFNKADKVVAVQPKVPTLTLANGQTIALNTQQKGITAGHNIRYLSGEPVVLSDKYAAHSKQKRDFNQNLRLTTPKGLIYELVLPDGSRVILNAGSTLSYPSEFAANERVVELEGEAFFEISKLNRPATVARKGQKAAVAQVPFKVKTAGQIVEVFGTKFNVNAYMDDGATQTTLVEGVVRVSAEGVSNGSARLSPGEQAQSDAQGISVRVVDTEHYTSWRNGYFYFDNAGIPAVLAQMQRWYDFNTDYESTIPDQVFSGKIPRNINLAQALNILRRAGINIRLIDDHQVVITSPKKNQ
ncbi:FecR family protein [Mucilaginibacter aquariorum]|uniref:DUF4974 domain-containing protein n=1 Tax=Mucilaginibacter aquariorum TaxID=2967225 RepID=A0ABT1T813_9SPHI|nr:FecR family protein [Mucilaginibacter aquariorum]MCQ6960765.1 DUF4974 domain-containing protein [Mucilaginibacter aquariorum]